MEKSMISSPEWVTHLQQIEESQGFDIDVFPEKCYYTNVDVELHNQLLVDLINNYALPNYNSDKGSCFTLTKVEKAVVCSICYFITFKAKDKKKEKIFQTKCCVSRNHKRVVFTRLKPSVCEGGRNVYVFKTRLGEYCQKVGLPRPFYETVKGSVKIGSLDTPIFRSTVIVNDVRYESPTDFFIKKTAEQSAAEVALVQLSRSGEMQECITQPENYEYTVLPIKSNPTALKNASKIRSTKRLKNHFDKVKKKKKKKQQGAPVAAAGDKLVAKENSNGSVVQVCSHEPTDEGCHDASVEVPACQ